MKEAVVRIYIGIEAPVWGHSWEPLTIEIHPDRPVSIAQLRRLTTDTQVRQSAPSWIGLFDRGSAVRLISTDPSETFNVGQLIDIALDASEVPFAEKVWRWLDAYPGKTHTEAVRRASQARFGAIC